MIRCYVTDRRTGDVLACSRRAARDGVDYIQVREKDLGAREMMALVEAILDLVRGSPTQVLVNDRLDVAIAVQAHGVHLPANGLPPGLVRPFVRVLGVSTHSVAEVVEAARASADFAIFGPVFDTPGKTGVGLDALRAVVQRSSIPVLAIGGIDGTRIDDVIATGAAGVAAIRMFQL